MKRECLVAALISALLTSCAGTPTTYQPPDLTSLNSQARSLQAQKDALRCEEMPVADAACADIESRLAPINNQRRSIVAAWRQQFSAHRMAFRESSESTIRAMEEGGDAFFGTLFGVAVAAAPAVAAASSR